MGKAGPKAVKIRAELLIEQFPDKFGGEFEKDKASINELELPLSPVSRNLIAGFISRKLSEKNQS